MNKGYTEFRESPAPADGETAARLSRGEAGGKVLMIFIDGLGIGRTDRERNPLAHFPARILRCFTDSRKKLPREGLALASNPGMGVPGLPQSATGQAALFTGINTAESVGRHLSGFPTAGLKRIVAESSILRKAGESGGKVAFANTYTEAYLHKLYPDNPEYRPDLPPGDSGFAGPGKKSVTTVMSENAGLRFRTE